MDLSGKTALVTGGSRGIGRAIAERLARAGAAVAINYNDTEPADLVDAIGENGGRALAIQADVADKAAVEAMVATVVREFGGLDILVNN
ncbi:MAG TPA: SDR family NAD(P)-dependent oxidoreductase, partial [Thermomicrobiales bacterium]|nr:SDR family NAD(P)-dependent oxidoreductase [Thermomicrobiales bacterium]